jgi:hypothetical protein
MGAPEIELCTLPASSEAVAIPTTDHKAKNVLAVINERSGGPQPNLCWPQECPPKAVCCPLILRVPPSICVSEKPEGAAGPVASIDRPLEREIDSRESRPLPRGVFLLVRPCPLGLLRTWTALRTVRIVETFGTRTSGRQKDRMGDGIDPPIGASARPGNSNRGSLKHATALLLRAQNAQPTRSVPRVSKFVLMRRAQQSSSLACER